MSQSVVHARYVREPDLIGVVSLLATTAVVSLTFNPVVVVLWIACWIFAKVYSGRRSVQTVFLLSIAIIFFYPEFTTVFEGYHEKWVVMAVLLVVGTAFFRPRMMDRDALLTRTVVLWIGWGLVAYLPVLGIYIWATVLGGDLPTFLSSVPHTTSALKTAAPIIPSALIAPLTVAALRTPEDLRRFRQALTFAVLIITTVSIVLWALNIRILPFDDARLIADTTRLGAFSNPDPNGTARLLLFPLLLFASASLVGHRLLGLGGWLALGLGVVAILLTQSRTTFVSFNAGLLVVGLVNPRKGKLWWMAPATAIVVAAIALTVDFPALFAEGGERFTSNSLIGRVALWEAALDIVRENPWVGAFPSGYFEAMQSRGALGDQASSAHSLYLFLAVEWGVALAGLALFVMFATVRRGWGAIRRAGRKPEAIESRVAGVAAVAIAVAYAVHGVTEIVPSLFLFLALGLAVAAFRVSGARPLDEVAR